MKNYSYTPLSFSIKEADVMNAQSTIRFATYAHVRTEMCLGWGEQKSNTFFQNV